MVKNTNNKIVREIDKLNDNETTAVLEFISEILSSRQFPIQTKESNFNDDLIASLSEKRENLRAQQVLEWEKARRRVQQQQQQQRAA